MTHTLTKSVSNQTKNALTPTRTSEIWLAEFTVYLQLYFILCFCITTVVYFMLCICMSPGMQHDVIHASQPYGLDCFKP